MMALNWDELQISIVDPDNFLVTEDELVYSLKAEQRMIIFGGERGLDGAPGADGKTPTPAGIWNSYKTYSRLDIVTNGASSYLAVTDVPIGIALSNQTYWQLLVSGNGAPTVWGDITGTLSNQTDLQNALDAKADTADLGGMASENDAPSDGKTYGRKNGAWAEVTGGGSGSAVWGDITGTLSAQTDLQTALNGKANTGTSYTKTEADALLADKADADSVYTKSEVNTALALIDSALADKADVGDSYTKAQDDALLADKVSTTAMQAALAGKQNTLTFDTTPTTESTNPVTSGGIKVAFAGYVALEVIADIYDPDAVYQTDDVFMKDGKLVRYVEGIEGLSPLPLSDYFETHLLYQGEYLAYDGSLYQATQSFELGPNDYPDSYLFQLAQPYLRYVNVDPYVPGQYFPIGHIVSYQGGFYTVIEGTDPQFIEISVEWLLSNRYYTKAEIDARLANL